MLHVWHIHQHLLYKSPSFVGKHTIHDMGHNWKIGILNGTTHYLGLPEGTWVYNQYTIHCQKGFSFSGFSGADLDVFGDVALRLRFFEDSFCCIGLWTPRLTAWLQVSNIHSFHPHHHPRIPSPSLLGFETTRLSLIFTGSHEAKWWCQAGTRLWGRLLWQDPVVLNLNGF